MYLAIYMTQINQHRLCTYMCARGISEKAKMNATCDAQGRQMAAAHSCAARCSKCSNWWGQRPIQQLVSWLQRELAHQGNLQHSLGTVSRAHTCHWQFVAETHTHVKHPPEVVPRASSLQRGKTNYSLILTRGWCDRWGHGRNPSHDCVFSTSLLCVLKSEPVIRKF